MENALKWHVEMTVHTVKPPWKKHTNESESDVTDGPEPGKLMEGRRLRSRSHFYFMFNTTRWSEQTGEILQKLMWQSASC